MGCKVSTQQKALPFTPMNKKSKPNSSFRVIAPQSQSQPVSPRNDSFDMFPEKKDDRVNSTGSVESRKSIGNLDNPRVEVNSRNKTFSPKIRIIGIGSSRASSSEDSIKKSDSLDVSPNIARSPKKEFTFHGETSSLDSQSTRNGGKLNRFLSINPKPSEFYMQKVLGDKNLVKQSTFGASSSSTEDVKFGDDLPIPKKKTIIKSMGEIPPLGSSLKSMKLPTEQEIIPDTPGFRSIASNIGSHMTFGLEEQKEDTTGNLSSAKSLIKKITLPKIDEDGHKSMSPELFAMPEGMVIDKEVDIDPLDLRPESISHHLERSLALSKIKEAKSRDQDHEADQEQQVHENDKEKEDIKISDVTASNMRRKSLALNQQIKIIKIEQVDQEINQENNGNRDDKEKGTGALLKPGLEERKKIITQQRFTQNLLDLLHVQKKDTSSPPKKTLGSSKNLKKSALDTSADEVNSMSLSLASSHQIWSDPQKRLAQINRDDLKIQVESRQPEDEKMSPLKLGTIEFLQNGEMVSPIWKTKSENPTPPFSNRTYILKSFLGGMEYLEEKTITNVDYLSRGDFEKYSFMAEIKEVEVMQNTSYESGGRSPVKRDVSKKTTFANFKTLGSQDFFNEERRTLQNYMSDEKIERRQGCSR